MLIVINITSRRIVYSKPMNLCRRGSYTYCYTTYYNQLGLQNMFIYKYTLLDCLCPVYNLNFGLSFEEQDIHN